MKRETMGGVAQARPAVLSKVGIYISATTKFPWP